MLRLLLVFIPVLFLATASCTQIDPAAIDGTLRRVCTRDSAYVATDPKLSTTQKTAAQLDLTLLEAVLDAAERK